MPRDAFRATRFLVVLVSMALVSVAGPASAHRMHLKDLIAESSIQRTVVWTLSAEIMQLTLKIDEQGGMVRLRAAHEQFGHSLGILRRGVMELQENNAPNADAMEMTLFEVTRQWAELDEGLRPVWENGVIASGQSRELYDLSRQLGRGIEEMHMHFHHAANHYGVVTVIGMAVMITERERSLGQRITSEFMAVVLESDAEDRIALGESVAQFENLLRALQYGDPELGLIPPPTADLRRKMTEIETIWRQMEPHLSSAIAGDLLTRGPVDGFAALSARLFAELGNANQILAGLVPGGRG